MKYFAWFQSLLYIAMLPLFVYSFGRGMNLIEQSLLMTLALGALVIGPVQYLSAVILLYKYSAYMPLRTYLAIGSSVIIVELLIWFYGENGSAFKYTHFLMIISGLLLGLYYIHICLKMGKGRFNDWKT